MSPVTSNSTGPRREQPPRAAAQQSPYAPSCGRTVGGGPHSQPRRRNGCLTCRARRKRCSDRKKDVQPGLPCSDCRRLRIECLGYLEKRPRWMTDSASNVVSAMRKDIKSFTRPFTQPPDKGYFSLRKYYENDPSFTPPFSVEGSCDLYQQPPANDDTEEEDSSPSTDHDDNDNEPPMFTPYPFLLDELHSFPPNDSPPPSYRATPGPTTRLNLPPQLSSGEEDSPGSSPTEPHSPVSFEGIFPSMAMLPQYHPLHSGGMTPAAGSSANALAAPTVIGEPGMAAIVPTAPQYHQHSQPAQQPCGQYVLWPHPLAQNDRPTAPYAFHYNPYPTMPDIANPLPQPESPLPFDTNAYTNPAQYSWPVSRQ